MFAVFRAAKLLNTIDNVGIPVVRSYLRRSAITYVILCILLAINVYQYFRAHNVLLTNLSLGSCILYLVDAALLAWNSRPTSGITTVVICIVFEVLTLVLYIARTAVTVITLSKLKGVSIGTLMGVTIIFALVSISAQIMSILITNKLRQKLSNPSPSEQDQQLPVAHAIAQSNTTVNAVYANNSRNPESTFYPSAPAITAVTATHNSAH